MNKFICSVAASAIATTMLGAAPASAGVTLVMGDNSLTTQIHADPGHLATGTTVYGLTKPGDVGVSFLSDDVLAITGGSGYAQISESSLLDANNFDNIAVFLTLGGGFTGYEFTIQYGSKLVSKDVPALLTITYDLVGGGGGSFSFLSGDPVLGNLAFENSAATDFRLAADGGSVLSKVTLTSSVSIDQIKQNDIQLAAAPVPEPSTWAMMLLGFGAAGIAMRRRRRTLISPLQIA